MDASTNTMGVLTVGLLLALAVACFGIVFAAIDKFWFPRRRHLVKEAAEFVALLCVFLAMGMAAGSLAASVDAAVGSMVFTTVSAPGAAR